MAFAHVENDFDGAWKEALEKYLPSIMAVCFPEIAAAIDWSKPWSFLDQELQEVVRDAELGKLRVDKLIRVQLLDGSSQKLLLHLESQKQRSGDFASRMFRYSYLLRDVHNQFPVSLGILGDEDLHWRPNHFHESQFGCSIDFRFPICKLLDFELTDLLSSPEPAALLIAAHLLVRQTAGDMAYRAEYKWRVCALWCPQLPFGDYDNDYDHDNGRNSNMTKVEE